MNFQRRIYGECDDGENEVSCKECSKLFPPTAFYTYSHTGYLKKVYHVVMLKLNLIVTSYVIALI